MNCIICHKIADEVGSHLIPASLIKNCVGKHYAEESYNIDAKTSKIEVYFGRDNLKNQSTEIKQNHYKRDNILCKVCEKKLADLESKFAFEFLQKFRIEKFKNNFTNSISSIGHEIVVPNKLTNEEVLAYFYSIILRFCKVYETESNDSYISLAEMLKIKKFLNGYLYQSDDNYKYEIRDFKLLINFNKYSDKSKFIATSNDIKKPYVFYFCEAIVLFFTENLDDKEELLFNEITNSIENENSKIVVGPESLYDSLSKKIADILAKEFITNGVNVLCQLNNKSYEVNLKEVNDLITRNEKEGKSLTIINVFEELEKKYSS